MKPRIAACVPSDVAGRLELAAKGPGTAKSDIVTPLDRFLDPARDKQLAAVVLSGQRELPRDLRRMVSQLTVVAKTLALFVRYVLTVTPPLREVIRGPPAWPDAMRRLFAGQTAHRRQPHPGLAKVLNRVDHFDVGAAGLVCAGCRDTADVRGPCRLAAPCGGGGSAQTRLGGIAGHHPH